MDYSNYLAGTPVLPLFPLLIFLALLLIAIHAIHRVSKKRKAILIPRYLKFFLVLALFLGPVFLGVSTPKVIKTSAMTDKVEIYFNLPVSRNILIKDITPETPGVWLFENPMYATHLYRKLTFYPDNPLPPGTTFTINLDQIKNVTKFGSERRYSDTFTTSASPTIFLSDTRISFQFYPENEAKEVSPDTLIKIVFADGVDKSAIEDSFSLSPNIGGSTSWQDNTFIFTPNQSLENSTKYQIAIDAAGINYVSTFTTRSSVSKLNVATHLQEHPLSCEVATLKMALNYRGVTVSEDELLASVGVDPTPHNGGVWGNPHQAFVGNVDGRQMTTGYGVYWEPIARVARNYRPAEDFRRWTVSQLTNEIENGNPVIIWTYSKGGVPTSWSTPSGEKIYAVSGEHTVLVVGFTGPKDNPTQIIVNDPLIGQVYWNRSLFNTKWSSFENSGVVVK